MFKEVLDTLNKANSILILTHINPDGDALGSSVGFKLMLEKMGKRAVILLEKELPEMFLVFGDHFIWEDTDEEFDLVVALDCGDIKRLGDRAKYFKGNTMCIDHHVSNEAFADVNYIDKDAAATGEIIYDIIRYANVPVCPDMASKLYGAILTDTGAFMFSNTTKKTHMIAADLIEKGADFYNLNKKLHMEKDYKRHFISAKLIENMQFYEDGKICVCIIDNNMATELGIKDEDLNGIAHLPRSVIGVEAGILISEITLGIVKVSLRSDEIVDVSKVAGAFGGGGHIRAAGVRFRDKTTLDIKDSLITEIKKQLEVK